MNTTSNQTPTATKIVLLVRHAKTDFNILGVQGRFCGSSNPKLNDQGVTQAERTGDALVHEGIKTIMASPLQRARATAEIIGHRLGINVVVDERLQEIDYGSWEGLTKEEIQKKFPAEWEAFSNDPIHSIPPGGEAPSEVLGRMKNLIYALDDDVTLLVGHKTAFRLLLCEITGRPLEEYRSFSDLHLSSITKLLIAERPQIITIDDRSHLIDKAPAL